MSRMQHALTVPWKLREFRLAGLSIALALTSTPAVASPTMLALPTTLALSEAAVVASAAASPSVSSAQGATTLALSPVAGRKLWKVISVEHNLVLMSRDFVHNGVAQLSQQEMELSSRFELHVQDQYRAFDAGRSSVLWRAFDRARQNAVLTFSDQPGGRLDGKSPLENISVVFTWVPEEHGYGAYCDAAEASEVYLWGLSQDLDLIAVLPGHAVQPGDAWEVKPDAMKDMLAFGGNLPMKFDRSPHATFARTMMSGVGGGLHSAFESPVQGRVAAKFVSLRNVPATADLPARELAVIELDVNLDANVDQTKHMQRSVRADEFQQGLSIANATLHWTFQGTGEVLWDVKEGRLDSYTLHGKEDARNELRLGSAKDGENRQALHMAGTMKVRFDVLTTAPAVVDDGNPSRKPEPDESGEGSGDDSGDDEK